MRRDTLICCVIGAAIGILAGLTYMAHPAYGQDAEQCTVQVFDPPLESGWLMPGDADTVRVTFTDGTGITLVGPFSIGDPISHPGLVAASIEKCTGVGSPPATPTPTPVPPTPQPEPTPTTTQIVEPPEHTTVVTPGPEPTPIIPEPPTPPKTDDPNPPAPGPIPPAVTPPPGCEPPYTLPTPTPLTELPRTGAPTGELVAVGLVMIAGGLMLATNRKWS